MKARVFTLAASLLFTLIPATLGAPCGGGSYYGVWNSDQTVCCSQTCGTCGGTGCAQRPAGPDACCTGNIRAANQVCGTAPCVKTATCANGTGVLNSTGDVCCAKSCGTCGGTGCDTRPGGYQACCQGTIRTDNKTCGTAPCVVKPPKCSIPCGRNTEYGKPFNQGSTPNNTCCTPPQGCYSSSYNNVATSCQSTVTCNTAAGETPCGHGSDISPHQFTDTYCCKAPKKCVESYAAGGTTSSCQ